MAAAGQGVTCPVLARRSLTNQQCLTRPSRLRRRSMTQRWPVTRWPAASLRPGASSGCSRSRRMSQARIASLSCACSCAVHVFGGGSYAGAAEVSGLRLLLHIHLLLVLHSGCVPACGAQAESPCLQKCDSTNRHHNTHHNKQQCNQHYEHRAICSQSAVCWRSCWHLPPNKVGNHAG